MRANAEVYWIVTGLPRIPNKCQSFAVFVFEVNTQRPNVNVLFKVKIVHK